MDVKYLRTYLDEERKAHQLTVEAFTKDIISPRTYQRYIYENGTISQDIIKKLLNRLNINEMGFIYGILASLYQKYPEEAALVNAFQSKDYESAKAIYEKLNGAETVTHFSEYELPIHFHKLNQYLGKISENEANRRILESVNLDALLQQEIVTDEPIGILSTYYDIIPNKYRYDLILWLKKMLDQEIDVYFSSIYIGYPAIIKLIFYLEVLEADQDVQKLEKVVKESLKRFFDYQLQTLLKYVFEVLIHLDVLKQSQYLCSLVEKYALSAFLLASNPTFYIKQMSHELLDACMKHHVTMDALESEI